MQLGQPVTLARRAPKLAERKYSQIRKELLAQVFGMEHNHHHVYVRKVILWTDQKLLVSISWKPLASVFKRLQCLLVRLQQHDCEIRYTLSKEILLADTLLPPRALKASIPSITLPLSHLINTIISSKEVPNSWKRGKQYVDKNKTKWNKK